MSAAPNLEQVLSSVRAQLADLDRRRTELEAALEGVDREHARLTAAVSVLEEHLPSDAPAQFTEGGPRSVPEPKPLTERILDALTNSSARTRLDLWNVFRPMGVNENTLDSALYRLKKRGSIEQRDKVFVVAASPPSDVSSGPPEAASPGG